LVPKTEINSPGVVNGRRIQWICRSFHFERRHIEAFVRDFADLGIN